MISVRRALLDVLSAWHGLAAFKNLCDLGAAFGIVPAAARWRSHNFAAMEKLFSRCGCRARRSARCWRASPCSRPPPPSPSRGTTTSSPSPSASSSSARSPLVDEAMADYELDETHRDILVLLLARVPGDAPDAVAAGVDIEHMFD